MTVPADPALPLQDALIKMLRNDSAIKALVDARVFDEPPAPAAAVFPYVTLGDDQIIGDDAEDCGDGSEVFAHIHVWTRTPGFVKTKEISAAIRNVLKTYPVLEGFEVTVVEFEQVQYLRDPDGKTRHGVLEFKFLISHTS
jgi:hypothetical protein